MNHPKVRMSLEFLTHLIDINNQIRHTRHSQRFSQNQLTPDNLYLPVQEKVEDPLKKIITDAIQASCTIFVQTQNGESWEGSGFHLGDGLIATAGHVVPQELGSTPHQIGITFNGKNILPAQAVTSSPEFDSGLIFCPDAAKQFTAVRLADSNSIEVGDIIAVIGSPQGFHDTATAGRVVNIHQTIGDPNKPAWNDFIMIDADIAQGASGGMVIGTDGLVIGSVMGMTGEYAEMGVGQRVICPANKIKTLVNQIAS